MGREYASLLGVNLTLECWNRYGTYLLNRLEQAVRLWHETELSNGGVMADTYHMNIEERSLLEAIREAGEQLNHVHLSDSNRAAPGPGSHGLRVDLAGPPRYRLPRLPDLRAGRAGRRTLRRRAGRR
jgi:sugar phosphate isomerase/epimerase